MEAQRTTPFTTLHDRYERKFVFDQIDSSEAEVFVTLHPARFREIYQGRYVNSMYFDSLDMDNYYDTVGGVSGRSKTRIRWYGALKGAVAFPHIELKQKRGLVVRKYIYPIPSFSFDESLVLSDLKTLCAHAVLPPLIKEQLHSLNPVALVRYFRTYFLSGDGKFRLTVDTEINYAHLMYQGGHVRSKKLFGVSPQVILELKYRTEEDALVDCITRYFPCRVSKYSKYMQASGLLPI